MTAGLHTGPGLSYGPVYKLVNIQREGEQGKESSQPKWDTGILWISAWDTELRQKSDGSVLEPSFLFFLHLIFDGSFRATVSFPWFLSSLICFIVQRFARRQTAFTFDFVQGLNVKPIKLCSLSKCGALCLSERRPLFVWKAFCKEFVCPVRLCCVKHNLRVCLDACAYESMTQ